MKFIFRTLLAVAFTLTLLYNVSDLLGIQFELVMLIAVKVILIFGSIIAMLFLSMPKGTPKCTQHHWQHVCRDCRMKSTIDE